MTTPLLSIVLPTYNGSIDQIDRCMSSICSQSFADFECLVLDDSTSQSSRDAWDRWALRDPRVLLVRSATRLGFVKSLNVGIEKARGEYIARCDTDDVNMVDRFARQVDALRKNPAIDVVGSATIVDRGAELHRTIRSYPITHDYIWRKTRKTSGVAHPTLMFRRASVAQFGGYDETFRYAEDVELCLRWMSQGAQFLNLAEPLVILYIPENGRPTAHWRYAFKARLKHFSAKSLVSSCTGLLISGGAMLLPQQVARLMYRMVRHGDGPQRSGS